ncbi:MAG: hypothetical protein AAGD28_23815 [Bacteroidota bacterium]
MKSILLTNLLILTVLFRSYGQSSKAGLIVPPEQMGPTYQCCVAIPQTGFTLYEAAQDNSIGGCIMPGQPENSREFYGYETFPKSGEEMVKFEDMHRLSYEVYCLEFSEESNGFVRINDSYWVKKEEIQKQKFSTSYWMDFLVKNSGNFMGYYANDPGLNLRKGVGTEFEKVITMKGDEMEISLTGEVKGLWGKVKVKQYKKHPCHYMDEGEPQVLNTYEGWAKILDDSGTPNLYYYAGGC